MSSKSIAQLLDTKGSSGGGKKGGGGGKNGSSSGRRGRAPSGSSTPRASASAAKQPSPAAAPPTSFVHHRQTKNVDGDLQQFWSIVSDYFPESKDAAWLGRKHGCPKPALCAEQSSRLVVVRCC